MDDQLVRHSGSSEVAPSQSCRRGYEDNTGSSNHIPERETCNDRLSEALTEHLPSISGEEEEVGTTAQKGLELGSPEIADSFESGNSYGNSAWTLGQMNDELDPNIMERTGDESNPISNSSRDEEEEFTATKITIDLTACDEDTKDVVVMEREEFDEADVKNYRSSTPTSITSKAPARSPRISIKLYIGYHGQPRCMRLKREARFETVTSVVCHQEQIPYEQARFLWKGEEIDLSSTPDSCGMGEEEEIHLRHELLGPFRSYPWRNRLTSGHQSTMGQEQDSKGEIDLHGEEQAHTITPNAPTKAGISTPPEKRIHATNAAVPETPLSHDIPWPTLPPEAAITEPSPRAKKLAIEAGFGNYSFLNSLQDNDRRMWAAFFAERRVADQALRNIGNLYRKPRSPDFTHKLIQEVAEQYPLFQDAFKQR